MASSRKSWLETIRGRPGHRKLYLVGCCSVTGIGGNRLEQNQANTVGEAGLPSQSSLIFAESIWQREEESYSEDIVDLFKKGLKFP